MDTLCIGTEKLTVELIKESFGNYYLPDYMADGLYNYLVHKIPAGGFMMAVLSNDLKAAASRADNINKYLLLEWADFVYNEMPAASQGSPERVKAWLESK